MVYEELQYGVYVQDIEGNLFKPESWNRSQNEVNGIAVYTEQFKFVVQPRVDYSSRDSFQTAYEVSEFARIGTNDFDGYNNTQKIINAHKDRADAAQYCVNHTFPNGQKGYLPSEYELLCLTDNIEGFNKCYLAITGTPNGTHPSYRDNYYWTSTESENEEYMKCVYDVFYAGGASITTAHKGGGEGCIVPFTKLNIK